MSELQTRGVLKIIQRQFFLFPNESVCCDSSLEPPQEDGSNDGSPCCKGSQENYPKISPVFHFRLYSDGYFSLFLLHIYFYYLSFSEFKYIV